MLFTLTEVRELPFGNTARFHELPADGEWVTISRQRYEELIADNEFINGLQARFSSSDDDGINGGDLVDWVAEHLERTDRHVVTEAEREAEMERIHAEIREAQMRAEEVVQRYLTLVRGNGAASMLAVVSEETAPGEFYSQVWEELCITAYELGYEADGDNRLGQELWEAKDDVKETLAREIIEKLES